MFFCSELALPNVNSNLQRVLDLTIDHIQWLGGLEGDLNGGCKELGITRRKFKAVHAIGKLTPKPLLDIALGLGKGRQ